VRGAREAVYWTWRWSQCAAGWR